MENWRFYSGFRALRHSHTSGGHFVHPPNHCHLIRRLPGERSLVGSHQGWFLIQAGRHHFRLQQGLLLLILPMAYLFLEPRVTWRKTMLDLFLSLTMTSAELYPSTSEPALISPSRHSEPSGTLWTESSRTSRHPQWWCRDTFWAWTSWSATNDCQLCCHCFHFRSVAHTESTFLCGKLYSRA